MNISGENIAAASIGVVIPAFNASATIDACLKSILCQSRLPLMVVVVDDASDDDTAEIVRRYEPKVQLIRNRSNQGAAASRNIGIANCQTDLIAFLDADDLALPHRLETQAQRFEKNADLVVAGGSAIVTDVALNRIALLSAPASDIDIRVEANVRSPFISPTVMVRRDVIVENRLAFPPGNLAEDYALWCDLLRVGRGENIQAPLILYRRHSGSITSTRRSTQLRDHLSLSRAMIKEILPGEGDFAVDTVANAFVANSITQAELLISLSTLDKMCHAFSAGPEPERKYAFARLKLQLIRRCSPLDAFLAINIIQKTTPIKFRYILRYIYDFSLRTYRFHHSR